MLTVSQLAAACGATLQLAIGDTESKPIEAVATIQDAGAGALTFLTNPKYTQYLDSTAAGVVVVSPTHAEACPITCLISKNPHAAYAKAAQALYPAAVPKAGVHASASVDSSATIGAHAEIAAGAVVCAGATVGDYTIVGPNCVVGENVVIGEGSHLHANVVVVAASQIGARVQLHPGVIVGGDGFGFARNDDASWERVPQIGRVIIADDVDIGANTTVDCGAIGDTVIGLGVKIDNQCQIAHNVQVGDYTIMSGGTMIAGSATIGERCMVAGGVGINGHISVPADTVLTARTTVLNSISEAGVYSSGSHAEPASKWRRNLARSRHLDDMAKKLRKLEKQVAELQASLPTSATSDDVDPT